MDASLVSAWTSLCQGLIPAFTAPTFITFLHLVSGWALCPGRAAVTHFICAIGASMLDHAAKHWSVYEKFFHRAAWSSEQAGRLLLQNVVDPLLRDRTDGPQDSIDLLIDDTTVGRCGKHVALAGYYKDASVSNTRTKVVHWAHNWVIGVVAANLSRWKNWTLGLPVLAALYRKHEDCDKNHPFKTRQQLAADLIRQTHQALPGRKIYTTVDGQYATKEVAGATIEVKGVLISRLRGDSALFELPPQKQKKGRGNPRRRGKRLPTPKAMAQNKNGWRNVYVQLHGKKVRRTIKSLVCLWWHVAKTQPIRVVIVKNPTGKRDDYLFSTEAPMSEQEIIQRYSGRWPVEEAIHDAKQHDGMEQTQGWCQRTVLRQAPMTLLKQTLIKAWYARCADRLEQRPAVQQQPWQPVKKHPSYRDMLAALRLTLWQTRVKSINSACAGKVDANMQSLIFTLCAAA